MMACQLSRQVGESMVEMDRHVFAVRKTPYPVMSPSQTIPAWTVARTWGHACAGSGSGPGFAPAG